MSQHAIAGIRRHFWGSITGAALILAAGMICENLSAFTVVKNVNSGTPPVEKAVIFEKGKPADHLILSGPKESKVGLTPDGAIEAWFVGSDETHVKINWKSTGDLKQSLNADDYSCLILTCRLEGTAINTQPNGKKVEQRADNLWLPVLLLNGKGEQVASANLADATDDGVTPKETTTLKIPMVLLTFYGHDTKDIQGVSFKWSKGRATTNRNFRLVIDKIAFAE